MSPVPKPIDRRLKREFDQAYGPLPVPVTVTNELRQFVWVNSACCRFYGKQPRELLGKTAACLLTSEELQRQQSAIDDFNTALRQSGHSIRRFTNTANGKDVRVVVVAFSRKIGRRHFRVGVAMPEQLTSFTEGIADLLVQGHIDLEGFLRDVRRTPGHERLMRELSVGTTLKEAGTYGGVERRNRKALERIVELAEKHCDSPAKRRMSSDTVKNLAVLLADRLLGL